MVVLLLCALPVLAVLPAAPAPSVTATDGRSRVLLVTATDGIRIEGFPGPAGNRAAMFPGSTPQEPAARKPAARAEDPADTPPDSTGAAVARLYTEAAKATEAYERGRRAAATQRARAARFERLLSGQRRRLAVIRSELGEVARSQYRTGGSGLSYTAQLLLADDPDELLRGRRLARQTDRAVTGLMNRARRALRETAAAERTARAAWHELDVRTVRLAAVKRGIAVRLETAQSRLQSEADRSVAAGKCAGAVRMEQPGGRDVGRSWVAPVRKYTLSAGFQSVGAHWARRHTGQDFAVDIGTPVRSVGAGRVVSVSCGGAFGIEIVVRHPDGYFTQYAHLADVAVDQGERVHAGQWIAQSGTTGNSTGPHLHFEVRLTPYYGSGVDPVHWLSEHGVKV